VFSEPCPLGHTPPSFTTPPHPCHPTLQCVLFVNAPPLGPIFPPLRSNLPTSAAKPEKFNRRRLPDISAFYSPVFSLIHSPSSAEPFHSNQATPVPPVQPRLDVNCRVIFWFLWSPPFTLKGSLFFSSPPAHLFAAARTPRSNRSYPMIPCFSSNSSPIDLVNPPQKHRLRNWTWLLGGEQPTVGLVLPPLPHSPPPGCSSIFVLL